MWEGFLGLKVRLIFIVGWEMRLFLFDEMIVVDGWWVLVVILFSFVERMKFLCKVLDLVMLYSLFLGVMFKGGFLGVDGKIWMLCVFFMIFVFLMVVFFGCGFVEEMVFFRM